MLHAIDHQCVFLTNQQADKENNWLSTVVARSRGYPSKKFAPKRKSDSTDVEKANVQIMQILMENDALHRISSYFPLSVL